MSPVRRRRRLPTRDVVWDTPPLLRVLVAEDGAAFGDLEPRMELKWCEHHMGWHRFDWESPEGTYQFWEKREPD